MTVAKRAIFVVPAAIAGGAERVLCILGRELMRRGFALDIVSLAACGSAFFEEGCPGATVHYGSGGAGAGREWRLIPLLAELTTREWPADLVVSSHLRMNAALSALRRVGLLHCDRLVSRESMTFSDRRAGLGRAAYRALYGFYGGQDLLVAQTRHMAERVREALPPRARERLVVLPNPVDVGAVAANAASGVAHAQVPADRPLLIWCGRMVAFKRPVVAVDALAALHAAGRTEVALVMIGDGPERGAVEARVAWQGLSGSVFLTGQLADPFPTMGAGRLGLITSAAFAEGFPNVLLEMMAAGLPEVVSTMCADGVAGLAGVAIAPFDPEGLAAVIAAALARAPGGCQVTAQTLDRHRISSFVDAIVGAPLQPTTEPA